MHYLGGLVCWQHPLHTHLVSSTTHAPTFPRHYRLRLALETAAVEPEEMAEHLGVHINTVRNYVGGRRSPNRSVLRVWALRTGVPFEWLNEGNEERPDPGATGDTGRVTEREHVTRGRDLLRSLPLAS